MGLLLYRGGMVCAKGFTEMVANAICRNMDYSRAKRWASRADFVHNGDIDDHFADSRWDYEMKLEVVWCYNPDWENCKYKLNNRCWKTSGVFLKCQGIEREFLFFPSPSLYLSLPLPFFLSLLSR